tara:strand:- start:27 stop:230 length:204 start_codon:yes stop_codon:yes gene_type:complete
MQYFALMVLREKIRQPIFQGCLKRPLEFQIRYLPSDSKGLSALTPAKTSILSDFWFQGGKTKVMNDR